MKGKDPDTGEDEDRGTRETGTRPEDGPTDDVGPVQPGVKAPEEDLVLLKERRLRIKRRMAEAEESVRSLEEEVEACRDEGQLEELEAELDLADRKARRTAREMGRIDRLIAEALEREDGAGADEDRLPPPPDLDDLEAGDPALVVECIDDELLDIEARLEEEEEPPDRDDRGFEWTPLRAIVLGVLLILVLPALLYSFVIPRVDFSVDTWYYEGFQNSIVIDAKIVNDGTVDIEFLTMNVSLIKVMDGVEVYLEEIAYDDPKIYPRSQETVKSVTVHDDQTADYLLLVQFTCTAGDRYIDKSYTHSIDDPYMSHRFEDRVFMWAL